ncbi:MAG: hypothetical protein M0036_12805 [Desulfobacteraceae bacterium]|nr:hypothetical protein [Desulfobacteraceae bacterium]
MKYLALTILSALIWLSAAAPARAETPKMCGSPNPAAPQKESAMFMDDLKTIENTTIPPIDRAAPVKFETAAFGLG